MQRGMMRGSVLTMDGAGTWLSVQGHGGIVEYGTQVLRLRLSGGVVRIEGEKLILESMDGEDILVVGHIDRVMLERG